MDIVMLLKIVRCARPSRLLEVGSYRGYTALLLAQHMDGDAHLVTVDQDERHGEAYRGTPFTERIDRRVGTTGTGVLDDSPGTYDFIFLDAGHKYHEVKHDTELLLPLLTQDGFILWHDYENWGFFNGINGVPEYLHELAQDRPVAQVSGTGMAMHSPAWSNHRREAFEAALLTESAGPWTTSKLRG
jgi:predicted O-methyltransferase YrrM